jgi:hypothetical protein
MSSQRKAKNERLNPIKRTTKAPVKFLNEIDVSAFLYPLFVLAVHGLDGWNLKSQ